MDDVFLVGGSLLLRKVWLGPSLQLIDAKKLSTVFDFLVQDGLVSEQEVWVDRTLQ